jgi:FKBP-type peptidyl-prolyl cis-trans isomerase
MIRALLPIILLASCHGGGRQPASGPVPAKRDELIDHNRRMLEREERDIDLWVQRQGVAFVTSGTGVRWRMLRDLPGDTARPEQLARVRYTVTLLNGDTCYRTANGAETFRVEHDEVESGLHEAIQHLSEGDSAIIVIPSHRAHGLAGDMAKVPMRSTVVYAIGLETLTGQRP